MIWVIYHMIQEYTKRIGVSEWLLLHPLHAVMHNVTVTHHEAKA
jgi:hypothetical protein